MTGASTVRRDFLGRRSLNLHSRWRHIIFKSKWFLKKLLGKPRESDKKHISDVAKDSSPELSSVKMKILVLKNIFMVD